MARKALGRGLDALIPNARELLSPASTRSGTTEPDAEDGEDDDVDEVRDKASNNVEIPRPTPTPTPTPAPSGGPPPRESTLRPIFPAPTTSAPGEAAATPLADYPPHPPRPAAVPSSAGPVGMGVRPADTESGRQALASGRAMPVIDIAMDRIQPNPYQPRITFDDAETEELAASIRSKGILQPVLVRRKGPGYELIAGERRLRAARRAGLHSIPALVREAGDRELLEIALIENEQRVELNPIESARSYARIINEFALSQVELADVLGRDRSTVANLIRLLRLPDKVQKLVQDRALSMGHARALVAVEDAKRCHSLAERAVRTGMPVRALERLVQGGTRKRPMRRTTVTEDPELAPFINRLRHKFATQVAIHRHNGKGKIEIEFYNQEDLERILEVMAVLHDG
jgi:ParB family transcriptional regulator, chromosome partitioning protein